MNLGVSSGWGEGGVRGIVYFIISVFYEILICMLCGACVFVLHEQKKP